MNGPDPIQQFRQWYTEAIDSGIPDPAIMTLATADRQGKPSARIVLLKEFDDRGFVFYTNYRSRKAGQMEANPSAALVIHWPGLGYQVRVEGRVERTSPEESDRYFASRPRGSQLGTWASGQSQVIPSRKTLEEAMRSREMEFRDAEVTRPPHWGGYRVVPERIEFWIERENRLHDRLVYERPADRDGTREECAGEKSEWTIRRLAP